MPGRGWGRSHQHSRGRCHIGGLWVAEFFRSCSPRFSCCGLSAGAVVLPFLTMQFTKHVSSVLLKGAR